MRFNEIRTYTPDFELPNGIIIESKGRFVAADRKKHLLVQKQHPELDIRFVFSNSKAKISKGSKTTLCMIGAISMATHVRRQVNPRGMDKGNIMAGKTVM